MVALEIEDSVTPVQEPNPPQDSNALSFVIPFFLNRFAESPGIVLWRFAMSF